MTPRRERALRPSRPLNHRRLRGLAWGVGAGAAALALGIDRLGYGKPGFGEFQTALLVAGIGLLLAGFAARPRAAASAAAPASGADPGRGFEAFRRRYVAAAILLLNVVVLFVGLNLGLALAFAVTDALGWTPAESAPGVSRAFGMLRLVRAAGSWASPQESSPLALADGDLARIYPGWSRADVAHLLRETRSRKLGYLPFAQFSEQAYAGRFVNVSEHGFRHSAHQRPWPPSAEALNVWILGGSTTFGYGLRDEETIPSFLGATLAAAIPERPVAVYNFGQAYYFSSQELALFYRLLSSPVERPDIVVFIDGINEHLAEPFYSQALRAFMATPYRAPYLQPQATSIASAEETVRRYVRNRELIAAWCRAWGIVPLFVWQPSPVWRYDQRYHLFPVAPGSAAASRSGAALTTKEPLYAAMDGHSPSAEAGGDCSWLPLADLQIGVEEPLYVDRIHYTAKFSRTIAERIGARALDLLRGGPCIR